MSKTAKILGKINFSTIPTFPQNFRVKNSRQNISPTLTRKTHFCHLETHSNPKQLTLH